MASKFYEEEDNPEKCKRQCELIRQLKLVEQVLKKPEKDDSPDSPVGNSTCTCCISESAKPETPAASHPPSRLPNLDWFCTTFCPGKNTHTKEIERRVSKLNFNVEKRDNYIPWEDYFMGVACLSAKRSKDPDTQVGACLVNEDKKIIGVGYNGMPLGCSDDVLPWGKRTSLLENKHAYVCHAEMNAILNKNASDSKGSTLYVSLFPCNECAKIIIQAGIKEVVYLHIKKEDSAPIQASMLMLECAKVKFRKLKTKVPGIALDFTIPPDVQ